MDGESIDNREKVIEYLRNTKALGVSGLISIKQFSNDPYYQIYDIMNVRTEDGGETWFLESVGTFCVTCALIVTKVKEIVWGDGTTNIPGSRWEQYLDCPFTIQLLGGCSEGQKIHLFAILGIIIFTTFISCVGFKIWKYHTY